MTVATYTSDLADIDMMEGVGSITDYGGGGGAASAGVDYAIEGTNAVDKQINNTERGFLFDNVSNFTIGADDHFYGWICVGTYGLADTRDNRGIVFNVGDDTSNFVKFHVNGSDTLPLGGMLPYAIRFVNTTLTNFRTLVGTPGTTPSQIGCGASTTGTAKFANLAMDAVRIGTGYDILNGTGADPEANFAGIAADDLTAREGVLVESDGAYKLQGKLRIGSASTACEFLDSNQSIVAVDTIHSLTDFTEILIENASSILTLTNVSFKALGTNNPGRFEVLTDTATLTCQGLSFIDWGVTVLGSGTSIINSTWVGADRIDLNEGSIAGSNILTSAVAADEGAVFDDRTTTVATDISELDNCTFTQGTNAHHAIRFGANVNDDITLTGIEFTDFSSVADAAGATLRFDATSGTFNCNLVGCTVGGAAASSSNVGVDDAAGATVTIVASVPVDFEVVDTDDVAISGARITAYLVSDDSEIINTTSDGSGLASTSFGGTVPADFYYRYRKSSTGATKYINLSGFGTIAATTGVSIKRSMTVDNTADPTI